MLRSTKNGFSVLCVMSYKKAHLYTLKHKRDLGMDARAYGFIFINRHKMHLRHV
jgi:hypothetical protein